MTLIRSAAAAFAILVGTQAALAGDMQDFEAAMRGAYGHYREALFATNAGKAEGAQSAVKAFAEAWTTLGDRGTPPQYADDSDFDGTMKRVAAINMKAGEDIVAGKLPEAHETLEAIRDEIGSLHARNGVVGFSDRMNAYHARMESVIGMDAGDLAAVREEAAVLAYLLAEIEAHPPADADGSFKQLLAGVKASVDALHTAASGEDVTAAKAAIGGLKAPYSKLFLKFG